MRIEFFSLLMTFNQSVFFKVDGPFPRRPGVKDHRGKYASLGALQRLQRLVACVCRSFLLFSTERNIRMCSGISRPIFCMIQSYYFRLIFKTVHQIVSYACWLNENLSLYFVQIKTKPD